MKAMIITLFLFLIRFSGLSAAEAQEDVKLYGTPLSPYARKVISILEYKNISYTLDPTLPATLLEATGQKVPEDLKEVSPLGKIPAIKTREGDLADSAVIATYLEEKSPEKALLPKSPYLKAKSLWFEKYADTEMSEVFHKITVEKVVKPAVLHLETDTKLVDQLIAKIPSILTYLEKALELSGTSFLTSHELTVGDIAILHQFYGLKIAGVELELKAYPRLDAYLKRGLNHPAILSAINRIKA